MFRNIYESESIGKGKYDPIDFLARDTICDGQCSGLDGQTDIGSAFPDA